MQSWGIGWMGREFPLPPLLALKSLGIVWVVVLMSMIAICRRI